MQGLNKNVCAGRVGAAIGIAVTPPPGKKASAQGDAAVFGHHVDDFRALTDAA